MVSGLHPGSKGDPQGAGPVVNFTMSGNMLFIFLLGLLGFTLFYVWLFTLRVRVATIEYQQSLHQP